MGRKLALASLLLGLTVPAVAGAFELSGSGWYRSDNTYQPFFQAAPVGPSNQWFDPFPPNKPPANPYMVPNWQRPPPGMGWQMPARSSRPRGPEQGPWYRTDP